MSIAETAVAIVQNDHRFAWTNRAFTDLVGFAENALVGKTFEEITHPDDIDLDSSLATRLFAGELDHYEMDKRYVHRNKSVIPIHLRVSLIRDRQNKILYACSIVERIRLSSDLHVRSSKPLTQQEREMDRIRRAMME
jgi:PAS domain S-box-containing protein